MITHSMLLAYVTTIQKQGVTAAAKHLRLTPAAISKQIKALEEYLGLKLLFIDKKGVKATEEGSFFYEKAYEIISQIKSLEEVVHTLKNEPEGLLRIFSGLAFGESFLMPSLTYFRALYPKINLDVELDDRIPSLEENYDLILGLAGHDSERLIQKKLFSTSYVLCASPEYLRKHSPIYSVADLSSHILLSHSKRPNSTQLTFYKEKKETQAFMNAPLKVNSVRSLLYLAENHQGIVNLQHYVVKDSLDKGRLQAILPDFKQGEHNLYGFYLPERRQQPKVIAFLKWLDSVLKEGYVHI